MWDGFLNPLGFRHTLVSEVSKGGRCSDTVLRDTGSRMRLLSWHSHRKGRFRSLWPLLTVFTRVQKMTFRMLKSKMRGESDPNSCLMQSVLARACVLSCFVG